MISAVNISLHYGERALFDAISFRIAPHDRIGLVGSNGAGKTTLLRLLVADIQPQKGEIAKAKYVTVGYLPQEGVHAAGRTLYNEVEQVFADVLETEARLTSVHQRMTEVNHDSEEFQELLEISGELQHKLEDSEAFRMKSKIEKVVMGLGFREKDFRRETSEFSGGWQMRIALAKLLLLQPSLLLLDEPTNHLDLDSLQWLESYLRSYDGAVMIVSHDRRFLDNMIRTTYDLSRGSLTEYPGNYSYYVKEREIRKEQQIAALKNQQQHIKQTEQFIDRFRYKATKARQVQSRIKQLAKMELVEVEEEESEIRFSFPPAPRSGRSMVELRSISKSYDGTNVFEELDFDVDRGDRIAFVGVNGAGKSTLSRILAGVEGFDDGMRNVGSGVIISYFAQHQADELDPGKEVLQTVDDVAVGEVRKRLRTLLGSFLFSGDDVFKKVRVLSGGEKSRLALARMLLQPANLLVMDEPTNHLDMRSKGVLQDALQRFEGSFIIVSHDRDFLQPLINKVVEFRDGGVKTYLGSMADYLAKRESIVEESRPVPEKSEIRVSSRDRKRIEAAERQERYKRTRPLKQKIEKIEEEIEKKEKRKQELEQEMGKEEFYRDGERVKTLSAQYKTIEQELSTAYFRWNDLSRELEKLLHESE